MLRAGLPVRDKLIERTDGRKFVTTLQVNVEQRGVEFVPGTGRSPRTAQTQEAKNNPTQGQAQGMENSAAPQKEQRRNTWTNADGSIRPISKWSGVNFTDKQKADYAAGKAIYPECGFCCHISSVSQPHLLFMILTMTKGNHHKF